MQKAFEICFYTGAIFAVVSFVFGEFFNILNFGAADFNLHVDMPDVVVSPLRPSIIAAFVTVFGGIGLMCLKMGKSIIFSSAAAVVAATIISFLLYRFVIVPLAKSQSTSSPTHQELIGVTAKMTLGVKGGSFGEIAYTVKGNSFNSPALSAYGEDISTGAEVVIVDIKEGVYYIKTNEKGE